MPSIHAELTGTVNHCFAYLFGNRERKRGLELAVSRTPQQEAEENAILEQAAIIQAARKAEQAQLQAQRKAAAPPPAGLTSCIINSSTLYDHLLPWCCPAVHIHHTTISKALRATSVPESLNPC